MKQSFKNDNSLFRKSHNYFAFLIILMLGNQSIAQNKVLQFDGIHDYVDVGNSVGNGLRTIELWFKSAVSIDSTLTDPVSLIVRNDDNENGEYGICMGPSYWAGLEGRLLFFKRDNGVLHLIGSDSRQWNAQQWYHVSGVIDPVSGMKLYVDGVLQTNTNSSTRPTNIRSEISSIGRWGNLSIRHFDGRIDEVRLWDRALTELEVQSKRCIALDPASEVGLKAYWRMNEGMGNLIHDSTANGNNGTIYGAIWVNDSITCTMDSAGFSNSQPEVITHNDRFDIYPNPFSSSLNIKLNGDSGKGYKMIIYNSVGEVVKKVESISTGSQVLSFDQGSKGVYFYQIFKEVEIIQQGKLLMN